MRNGTSVLILGAGMAGMCAAYELRKAGYQVQILEYNDRPGGRNWSLYGGDTYTELGGFTQKVQFAPGLYLNPGPWRMPHHHYALLDYCKRLKVALEPFTQVNYAAYVHSRTPSAASRSAIARCRRISTAMSPSCCQVRPARTRSTRRSRAKTAKCCSRRCASGARSTRTTNTRRACSRASGAAGIRIRAAALTSVPTPSEPMAMCDLLQSRLWTRHRRRATSTNSRA